MVNQYKKIKMLTQTNFTKRLILAILFIGISVLHTSAKEGAWSIGYTGNVSYTMMSGLDDVNTILASKNLPMFSTELAMATDEGLFLESGKWVFSLGKYNLSSTNQNELEGWCSDFAGKGGIFKVGYNILGKSKSDLYINVGAGSLAMTGVIRPTESKKLDEIDLINYTSKKIEFKQATTIYQVELVYLYPLLTNVLKCSDLYLGANCSYRLTHSSKSYLNDSSIDLGNTHFSGFNAGLSLKWSFDILKIINQ